MARLASALRALAAGAFAWVLIQALLFALAHSAPGGPAAALAGDFATRETQAAISRSFALDRPLVEQFATFLWRMGHGDWGLSYHFRQPVGGLLVERLPPTLLLMGGALALGIAGGRALGIWAAAHPRGGAVAAAAAIAVYALPVFWIGQLLMLGPGLAWGWFPVSGLSNPRLQGAGAWVEALDIAWHAVLPMATLALHQTAFFTTVAHAKARLEIGSDYVRAARARGIDERAIVWGHVARNVAPPVATVALNRIGTLFAGAVLVETLYAWPGLGRLLAAAVLNRDHPVLLGAFGLVVATVIASSIAADLLQSRLDPRLDPRLGAGEVSG